MGAGLGCGDSPGSNIHDASDAGGGLASAGGVEGAAAGPVRGADRRSIWISWFRAGEGTGAADCSGMDKGLAKVAPHFGQLSTVACG